MQLCVTDIFSNWPKTFELLQKPYEDIFVHDLHKIKELFECNLKIGTRLKTVSGFILFSFYIQK